VIVLLAAAIVAGSIIWSARAIAAELSATRADLARSRALTILSTFAPAAAAAQHDPRALLQWHPLARAARSLFPEDFAAIDRALGAAFPYAPEQVEAAHAQWTAEWLAWERAHDAEYKRRAAEAERQHEAAGSAATRAALDSIEREKLDLYQRRYAEYVRVAKALQSVQK